MGAMTLSREDSGDPCSKCTALKARGEVKAVAQSTYRLRQDHWHSWQLCTNHAAAASHAHKIPPFYTGEPT